MSTLDWPTEYDRTLPEERESYPHGFEVTRSEAFDSILAELRKMDATNVQLDTGAEHQKSNPNNPYANASFDDPGVVVRYELDGRQYAIPMDRWNNPRDNARAIALTLKSKRVLTRYGVETIESEFARHELPPAEETVSDETGRLPHEVLGVDPDAPAAVVRGTARSLKATHHPDRGGDRELFKRIVAAEEAILDG